MNLMKVTFDIDIENDEQITIFNAFVKSMKSTGNGGATVTAPIQSVNSNQKAAPAATAPAATAPAATAPAATAPAATAPAANSATPPDMQKLNVIRSKMAPKLGNHRDAIKAELTRIGSPNLTELPVDRWVEFENFIDALV